MTRASLLHILDHVNGISDAEVRELEQLAAAFPYCQTAHVLLAKAAHDRGSMLASQRLRRAATYAADRELLRQLLEQPAAPAQISPAAETYPSAPQPTEPLPADVASGLADELPDSLPPAVEPDVWEIAEVPAAFGQPKSILSSGLPAADIQTNTPESTSAEAISPPSTLTAETNFSDQPEAVPTAAPEDVTEAADGSEAMGPLFEPAAEEAAMVSDDLVAAAVEADEPEDDVLPAVAPPIRPPADAGISRFEFGLSTPGLPEPVAYQLPGLEDDADDAEQSELPTLNGLTPGPPPALVTAPFRADEQLGYALGAGSRLGYDLQAHDGYTLDLPLEAFFEPDALLLAHLQAHQPKPAPSSLDLINRFLKTQPRIKTPAGRPLPAEQQPDLSVRSTSTAPALASESLAKIMVRQGKKDKAIEIYERLMERQPEKKAYFADQIQQLQQPSE
jgi:hypothetical protein